MDDVDYSAAETIRSLRGILKQRGIRLVAAHLSDDIKHAGHYRLGELLGEDASFDPLEELVARYRENIDPPANSSTRKEPIPIRSDRRNPPACFGVVKSCPRTRFTSLRGGRSALSILVLD